MKKYLVALAMTATIYTANTGQADTTETLTRLQTEYQQTSQKLQETQVHLYRLEGAISILQDNSETAVTDAGTSATRAVARPGLKHNGVGN